MEMPAEIQKGLVLTLPNDLLNGLLIYLSYIPNVHRKLHYFSRIYAKSLLLLGIVLHRKKKNKDQTSGIEGRCNVKLCAFMLAP